MTQYLEEAIGKHVLARESYIKEDNGRLTDNLYFSSLHEDGEVTHHFSRVCFADLHYLWGQVTDPDNEDLDDDDREVFNSTTPITHIILHKWGINIDPTREMYKSFQENYLRAVTAWCQLFGQFVEERDEAIIVDVRQANVDCIGAMLVGFRNLGEQQTYTVFNLFIENEFSLSQAAWLSQCLKYSSRDGMHTASASHRIMQTPMHWMPKKEFFSYMNTCPLFDQKKMLGAEASGRNSFRWSLGSNYSQQGSKNELLKWFHELGLVGSLTDYWKQAYYDGFDVKKTIQFFKENRA